MNEIMNLKKAASHIHMEERELLHCVQRGEIKAIKRGEDYCFEHRELDEWAQRHLLSSGRRELGRQHEEILKENRREKAADWGVSSLLNKASIELNLASKTKGGVLRDMVEVCERSGLVYDSDVVYRELVAREEAASTAVGGGAAFLHPRWHDPFYFEQTFIAYARAQRPIYFGAPDDEPTRHFFVVCSTDHELHLHILARLAVMVHGDDLLAKLDEAADADAVVAAIEECEKKWIDKK